MIDGFKKNGIVDDPKYPIIGDVIVDPTKINGKRVNCIGVFNVDYLEKAIKLYKSQYGEPNTDDNRKLIVLYQVKTEGCYLKHHSGVLILHKLHGERNRGIALAPCIETGTHPTKIMDEDD